MKTPKTSLRVVRPGTMAGKNIVQLGKIARRTRNRIAHCRKVLMGKLGAGEFQRHQGVIALLHNQATELQWELKRRKIPNSNIQHPEKSQVPIFNGMLSRTTE